MTEETMGFCNSKCKHPVYTKEEVNYLLDRMFLNENFKVISGSDSVGSYNSITKTYSYPKGFNVDNCVVTSIMIGTSSSSYKYPKLAFSATDSIIVSLDTDNISVILDNDKNATFTYYYKVVLMKVS